MRTMNHSDGRTRYKIAFLKFISDTTLSVRLVLRLKTDGFVQYASKGRRWIDVWAKLRTFSYIKEFEMFKLKSLLNKLSSNSKKKTILTSFIP